MQYTMHGIVGRASIIIIASKQVLIKQSVHISKTSSISYISMKLTFSHHACMDGSYTVCYARHSRDTYVATNSNAIASLNSNGT